MPVSTAAKKKAKVSSHHRDLPEGFSELKFISDLGRSLLFTVHPKKVASRVADATRRAVGAELCVFVAELENIGVVSCGFDAKGEMDPDFLDKVKFEKWADLLPPQVGYAEDKESEVLAARRHTTSSNTFRRCISTARSKVRSFSALHESRNSPKRKAT